MQAHMSFEAAQGWEIAARPPALRAGTAHRAITDLQVLRDQLVSVAILRIRGGAFWPNRNMFIVPRNDSKVRHDFIRLSPSAAFLRR